MVFFLVPFLSLLECDQREPSEVGRGGSRKGHWGGMSRETAKNTALIVKSALCTSFHSLKGVCSELAWSEGRALTTRKPSQPEDKVFSPSFHIN